MLILGRCHCSNIAFTLDWTPDPLEIPARACGCSFCVKHAGVWTSSPSASLQIHLAERSRVSRYRFGTKTAEFLVCSECGVAPVATSEIDGTLYAVVNVNSFEHVPATLLRHSTASFDGEDTATRLARRKRHWIGRVEYADPWH